MSRLIADAKRAIKQNQVPAKIAEYELLIDESEKLFELNGKKLEDSVKNHAKDLMFYDMMLQECKTIEYIVKQEMEAVESNLFTKLTSIGHGQRAIGTREAPQYIKGDPAYVNLYQILIEVQYTRTRLEAVVEALKSMAYSLNNIVKIRVSQLEHTTL